MLKQGQETKSVISMENQLFVEIICFERSKLSKFDDKPCVIIHFISDILALLEKCSNKGRKQKALSQGKINFLWT